MEDNKRDCCLCGKKIIQGQENFICENCTQLCYEKQFPLWRNSIETLFKAFSENCFNCLSFDDPEDIHTVRVLGRKIQAVLKLIGLPKKHPLLRPIKEVHLNLKKIREIDVFLVEMKKQYPESKFTTELIKLLLEKRKNLIEHLSATLPLLIKDSYYNKVNIFTNDELFSYVVKIDIEEVLQKNEEHFNQLEGKYNRCTKGKGRLSTGAIKRLHNVRKKAKSLRYMYDYFDEVFGEKHLEKANYYKQIQSQLGKINDLRDWLELIEAYEKKIAAPKKDLHELKKSFQKRLKHLLENVEFNRDD